MSPNFKRLAAAGCIVAATFSFTTRAASATSLNVVTSTNNSLVDDLDSMSDAAKNSDAVSLSQACVSLGADADTALGYRRPRGLPTNVWSHMRGAWTDYSQAGLLCQRGADSQSPELINQSSALLRAATVETKTATALLKASRG